jgi:hypothetical protein
MSSQSKAKKTYSTRHGLSQLTLVEHSLCPLDARTSLKENFSHACEYRFMDPERGASTARVKVAAYEGLSAHDEFYLWGLLGITFAEAEPSFDLHVTPHYCLRHFDMIDANSKGGKSYRLFRESIRRLSAVRYQNDRFWDPITREHRQVSFGFFSYSLPIDPESSRAWRIVWDPLFFEICQGAGSQLGFDLATYRELDPASRRLFLLLKKVFWRRETSPRFDLIQLAVDVLGFSPDIDTCDLKKKVRRSAEHLLAAGIIEPPAEKGSWFTRRAKGVYAVQFQRGPNVNGRKTPRAATLTDSPLHDPLRSIGFDDRAISQILSQYSPPLIRLWSDITLAAIEHKGVRFFRRSPQAYFLDGLRKASSGVRTPPDWFHDIRKAEELREAERQRQFREANSGKTSTVQHMKRAGLSRAVEPSDVESVVRDMLSGRTDRDDG